MRKRWLNNGEPDADGNYEIVIENRDGKVITRYKAESLKELADLAVDSQVEANRHIGRLLKPDQGRTPLKMEPKELSDGDTLRIAQELDDPDPTKRVRAVNEIIEARFGGKPEAVASEINEVSKERSDAYYAAEAEAFVQSHPEYYPVKENQNALFRELMTRQIDLTRNNLEIVYADLLERGDMVPWPNGDQPADTDGAPVIASEGGGNPPPTPATRPRRINVATGIRNQDANASPPRPTNRKTIVTKAELANMSRAEYMTRLREPEFRAAVDALA